MAKMGRPTDALKHRFERILEEANAYEKFKQILIKTKKEEVFLKAFDVCHDRAFGKPAQALEVTGADGTPLSALPEDQFERLLETRRRKSGSDNRRGAEVKEGG